MQKGGGAAVVENDSVSGCIFSGQCNYGWPAAFAGKEFPEDSGKGMADCGSSGCGGRMGVFGGGLRQIFAGFFLAAEPAFLLGVWGRRDGIPGIYT